MGSAGAARGLCANHAVAAVFIGGDTLRINGLVEAGPSRSGIELCAGVEQFVTAGDAFVDALLFRVRVLTGERTLCAFLAANMKLFRRKILFPILVGLLDFLLHGVVLKVPFAFAIGASVG